jgi:hypothetical protein
MCRKMRIPHPTRRQKTLQQQNTNRFTNCLVRILKPPPPHKEKNKIAYNSGQATAIFGKPIKETLDNLIHK